MDKMTPREALTKLINILENSSAYVNEDGFPMGTLRKTYDTDEAEKVLEALVIATEQAPTLEKLGYKLDKVLHEKGGTIWEYVNNLDYCISISKENGDTEYHAFKTAFGEYLVFTESELRAIVREIEEEKMKGKEKTK